MQICGPFLFIIVTPLLIFDSQLLFNYGLFQNAGVCVEKDSNNIKPEFRRAIEYPVNFIDIKNTTPILYYSSSIQVTKVKKKYLCMIWNVLLPR